MSHSKIVRNVLGRSARPAQGSRQQAQLARVLPVTAGPLRGEVANRGGGFAHEITDPATVTRNLLVLGTAGYYYRSGTEMTMKSLAQIRDLVRTGHAQTVFDVVRDVYESSAAPKQEATFMVWALLAHPSTYTEGLTEQADIQSALRESAEFRRQVMSWVTSIRVGTHFLMAMSFYKAIGKGGFGRLPKTCLGTWFTKTARGGDEVPRTGRDLAYQVLKYYNRNDFTMRDVLRLVHVDGKVQAAEIQIVLRLVTGLGSKQKSKTEAFDDALALGVELDEDGTADLREYLTAVKFVKTCEQDEGVIPEVIALVRAHRMPREYLQTWFQKRPEVWMALLLNEEGDRVTMPFGALVRSLNRLTSMGCLADPGVRDLVVGYLTNETAVSRSHIHPAQLVVGWKQYSAGRGLRGKMTWTPIKEITDALERAFYLSFGNVEPTGLRTRYILDGSGSMLSSMGAVPNMSSTEACGALAMVSIATEEPESVTVRMVSNGIRTIRDIVLDREMTLAEVAARCRNIGYTTDMSAGIDQALIKFRKDLKGMGRVDQEAFLEARATGDVEVLARYHKRWRTPEAFIYFTDNDVNSGRRPSAALAEYREKTGIPAKMVVYCTQAGNYSICDPTDALSMTVAGFDTTGPGLVSAFLRGEL